MPTAQGQRSDLVARRDEVPKEKILADFGIGSEHEYVMFMGDAIEFQNGFGKWVNMKYHCTMRISDRVVDRHRVIVVRGRFPSLGF